MKIEILGISEVRWTGADKVTDEDGCFIYSGGEKAEKGVGVMLATETAKSLKGYWGISERVILVKLEGKPINVNIIQAYAPTTESTEEEIEKFYEDLNKAKLQCKNHEVIITMGDLNAKVGRGRGDVVGPYGLGTRNERGEKWIDWCEENRLMIVNTWFRQHPRRLYTWKSPGDLYRNQIDYITVNKRFRTQF